MKKQAIRRFHFFNRTYNNRTYKILDCMALVLTFDPVVNLINILCAAFTIADPKRAKMQSSH